MVHRQHHRRELVRCFRWQWSGVYGYSFAWSTTSGTLPDTVADTTGTTITSPALTDSGSWYFHIRTRDNVGNWSAAAVHLGPFQVDTTPHSARSTLFLQLRPPFLPGRLVRQ